MQLLARKGAPVDFTGSLRTFVILTAAAVVANLTAFVLTVNIPAGFSELNPVPKGISPSSLMFSEGLLMVGSGLLYVLVRSPGERNLVQSSVAALLLADAINDLCQITPIPLYGTVLISYGVAALFPTFFALHTLSTAVSAKGRMKVNPNVSTPPT